MNKHQPGEKRIKRPGRAAKVRAKRKASAMASVQDLADALGIGLNAAYELVRTGQVQALRFESSTSKNKKQRRFLIPRTEIARLTGGVIAPAPAA